MPLTSPGTRSPWPGIWALEALRDLTWILFLLRLLELQLRARPMAETVVRRLRMTALALGPVLTLPIESWAGAFRSFETVDLAGWRIALFVVLPVAGVVLVEQV